MRNILTSLFVLIATSMNAENHYVYLTDGRVLGYPTEMVKEILNDGEEYRLTLQNDSVLSWKTDDIKEISNLPPTYPTLETLTFREELNDELTDDIEAIIADGKAMATIPAIGKYLTPTFSLSDTEAKAYINGVEQVSGVSRPRFADDVVYTIAYDGHEQLAVVKLTDEVWGETGLITEEIALTTDMLSTNAPTSIEGEGLDMMLDGDASTFFHSTWSKDEVYDVDLTKQIYVQVDLKKAIQEFQFHYIGRPNTERYNIQEWKIEASEDGTSWTEVEVLNEESGLTINGQGVDYTSPAISMNKAYSHLRFIATKVGYKNYLCLAEFNLHEVTAKVEQPELLQPATYDFRMVPMGSEMVVDIVWPAERTSSVPRIDIDIDGGATVTSKDYYLNALITIQGQGVWPNFQDSVQIKGRGNTSWRDFDKKPYRLKFAKSVKPFGWKKGKNWNLLAQAQTGSMITNPVAMKIARMVGAASANNVMPVDLYMNGKYLGSYLFTQKTGLANNSVDIEDETQAAFLELDRYYDETYKFKSANYALPVNIKEPDFSENESIISLEQIKSDFNQFETSVKQNSNYERLVDMDKLVRFMLVNELVLNAELGHPKSVFLYRENLNYINTAYTFGPVWDFDWAFGYESKRTYCTGGATNDLFYSYDTSRPGSRFFTTLWHSSPWVKCLYYRLWKDFMKNHLQEVLDYVDDYYTFAKTSFVNNTSVWSDGNGYDSNAERMKQWLTQRADYLMGSLTAFGDEEPTPYTFGDVNTDGVIDEEDLQTLVTQLLGKELPTFSSEQADIDANDTVSASDLAWLCSHMTRMTGTETSHLIGWNQWDMSATENQDPLSLEIHETEENTTWQIAVMMDNKLPYTACMMDLTLPKGFTDANITPGERTDGTHIFTGEFIGENQYRIIGYSPLNLSIDGTEGAVFNLSLASDGTLDEGTYPIEMNHIRFVRTNGEEVAFADAQATLSIDANNIHHYTEDTNPIEWPTDIYDMQGRLIRHQATSLEGLDKGIYIINRRKVVKELISENK